MSTPAYPGAPSLETQANTLKQVNLAIMEQLGRHGTLSVARKRFAHELFDLDNPMLDRYAERISSLAVGNSLRDNSNFSIYMDKEVTSKAPLESSTWFGLVYGNGVFEHNVAVGRMDFRPGVREMKASWEFGFDDTDLMVTANAAFELMKLRRRGRLPNLTTDLVAVE